MLIHTEKSNANFKGTIIDLETIGDFNYYNDSRRYKDITPTIFGFIDGEMLQIFCAKNKSSIPLLKKKILNILPILKKPFHAFNSDFERGVLFHFLGKKIDFDSELNKEKFEKKEYAIQALKIPCYDDPFLGDGKSCMVAWLNGNIGKAVAHNRSCLLKERDILMFRGNRKPDVLEFKKGVA